MTDEGMVHSEIAVSSFVIFVFLVVQLLSA
jgi:hypothetical protein